MSFQSQQLMDALGLIPLQSKQTHSEKIEETQPEAIEKTQPEINTPAPVEPKINIEKNEYRLLIKMLQAIDHACEFKRIEQVTDGYAYHHPNIELRFTGLSNPDTPQTMHLATLADLLSQPALKRPVWEKLKTIKP